MLDAAQLKNKPNRLHWNCYNFFLIAVSFEIFIAIFFRRRWEFKVAIRKKVSNDAKIKILYRTD